MTEVGEILLYLGNEDTTKEEAQMYFFENGSKDSITLKEFYDSYIKFNAYQRLIEVFEMAADGEMIQVKVARGNLNFCGKQVKIDYERFDQIVQGKERDDKISYKWLIKEMN